MSLYTDYLNEIESRKEQGLHPKPIEDAALVEELIAQINDTGNAHRADSLNFLITNTLPGTTSAAGVKARFLKEVILGTSTVEENLGGLRVRIAVSHERRPFGRSSAGSGPR